MEVLSILNKQVKIFILFLLLNAAALLLLAGCTGKKEDSRLHILEYKSELLGKDMISQVYLPENYDETASYPVLYFFPGGSGSSYMVMSQFGFREAYNDLISAGEIAPMILVAVGIELSFGMNSADEASEIETEYDYTIKMGPYEDYFLPEVLPMIESTFAVSGTRKERYIGGYSMGGLAALHLAMRSPELFSKAGGHSPTLFLDDEIDLENDTFVMVRNYYYGADEQNRGRNPMELAQYADLSGLSLFLDTGPEDINARATAALGEILSARNVDVQTHLLPGTHGTAYCANYMKDYLRFYGGSNQ